MNVNLPTQFEEFARRKVATGEFKSLDEVICEGLRLLELREEWKGETREKIDQGWEDANSSRVVSPDQAREHLTSRKEVWRKRNE